mmetsp:Transcript_55451/g.64010  ORF Transcript_55451/g.64010 Transcript_55451/m.64010 type:complete len:300 (+) Transcript_55451:189-1088(+)
MADLLSFGDPSAGPPPQQAAAPAPMGAPPPPPSALPPPPPPDEAEAAAPLFPSPQQQYASPVVASPFAAAPPPAARNSAPSMYDDVFGAPPPVPSPPASMLFPVASAPVPAVSALYSPVPPASSAPASSHTSAASADTLAAARKAWMTEYYQKVNPTKIHMVDKMLVKYLGKEEFMMEKLSLKYGVLPLPMPTADSIAATSKPTAEVDLLGGIAAAPPARPKMTKRASIIDKEFLETLSPEFIKEQEELMKRIKNGNPSDRRAVTPPRGRSTTTATTGDRRKGLKKRASSLQVRKGMLC